MQYDFDTVTDRRGTFASKWDVAEGELPLTIADMDFATCPEIMSALRARLEKGLFGYTDIPDAWKEACRRWWKDRHGFPVETDWIVFSTGVVPTISSCVRKLCTPAEKVLVLTPVYSVFFNSILNNGCVPYECPLDYSGNAYAIPWERLEQGLSDPQTAMMILCNPHNPTGQIWDRDTLKRIGRLCHEHHVTVLSDEIHCDLTDPGRQYVPFASVDDVCRDISVTAVSPSKSFSIPGLQSSAVIVPDPHLRHRVWRALNTDECGEPNAFAIDAAIAAWTRGDSWLDACCQRLYENKQRIRAYIGENLPEIRVLNSEATYLLWLDVSALTGSAGLLARFIRERTGLVLSDGAPFRGNGSLFLRMNAAYPVSQITDALERLKRGVSLWNASCLRHTAGPSGKE